MSLDRMSPASRQLLVNVEPIGDVTVVAAEGEVDVASVAALRERLVELAVEGRVHVVLDLNGVSFLDSMGLGAIIATRRKFKSLGGQLVLACSAPVILKLLRLTSLDKVVPLYATVDEALAAEFPPGWVPGPRAS